MYSLELMDGSVISNLTRLSPSTFQLEGDNSAEIYFKLTQDNLACATLYKDGNIEEMFLDYMRQNFSCFNGVITFKIAPMVSICGKEGSKCH